jgi:Uma2 family endonuclease
MPIHEAHYTLREYLSMFLNAYLSLRPLGLLRGEPFVMRHPEGRSFREPDLMFIARANLENLTPTLLLGPADLAIEITSPESYERDTVTKYAEYAAMGVGEYWILDPHGEQAFFYRLGPGGEYEAAPVVEGVYTTPLLPGLRLVLGVLWQQPRPNIRQIVAMVDAMLGEGGDQIGN